VVSWGFNEWGQLGDGTTVNRLVPVLVNTGPGSALVGKKVVAIAAGTFHNLALCSDGTLLAWGYNENGQLGDGTTNSSLIPVAVAVNSPASALKGKVITKVAAGGSMSAVLCADGSMATWGENLWGGLGDGFYVDRHLPTAVDASPASSALSGKRAVRIAVGRDFCLALCVDGSLVAWGGNAEWGQAGDGSELNHASPVTVNLAPGSSGLAGKTVVDISAGGWHSLALCSDGTTAGWGWNTCGQLGDGTKTDRRTPVATSSSLFTRGEAFVGISGGSLHTLALVAEP